MRFAVPLGYHDDAANPDNAVLGEGIAKVLYGRRIKWLSLALGMLVVEAGKLSIVVGYAVCGGFHQPAALSIEGTHAGLQGVFLY